MKKIDLHETINRLQKIDGKNCKTVWNISQSFVFFLEKSYDNKGVDEKDYSLPS